MKGLHIKKYLRFRRKKKTNKSDEGPVAGPENIARFSYDELVTATKRFSPESIIGHGFYGPVYMGTLGIQDHKVVAIQLLNPEEYAEDNFLQEVHMLTDRRHPNLVNVIGYCDEGDKRIFVSEFVQSNLESCLHALTSETLTSEKQLLDWNMRMRIAIGVARGLNFLHSEAHPAIMYMELKSSNILLSDSFDPKLADTRCPRVDHQSHASSSTAVMDNRGYQAPEYTSTGELTLKSDVYSFGILLLELISGHKAFDDTSRKDLLDWVSPQIIWWKLGEIIDPVLKGKFSEASLVRAVKLVLWCTQVAPELRPTMAQVVLAMENLMTEPNETGQPSGSGEDAGDVQEGSGQEGSA